MDPILSFHEVQVQKNMDNLLYTSAYFKFQLLKSQLCDVEQSMVNSSDSDRKITDGVLSYFNNLNNLNNFNKFSIFDDAFNESYEQAIIEFQDQKRDESLSRVKLIICSSNDKDSKSIISRLPKEIALNILGLERLLTLRALDLLPSCKDFQSQIFKTLVIDEKAKDEIRKILRPRAQRSIVEKFSRLWNSAFGNL